MLELKVWSDFALFTRPESKVERVTYDVMTPSAARGVLEAILWKPEMAWQVREIVVLKPIKRLSLLRNEVNSLASARAAKAWRESGGGFNADADRSQRHSLLLRDVAYVIRADITLKAHARDPVAKYAEMFNRRVLKGQCHHQPYLGTREFSAFFESPNGTERPIAVTDDLGRMLFDLDFTESKAGSLRYRTHDAHGIARTVKGTATARYFNARLQDGTLRVPRELYSGTR